MDKNIIKSIPLFRDLNESELETIGPFLKTTSYHEGETIIADKEESDVLFILISGKVSISKKMTLLDHEEKLDKKFTILSSESNPFFGEVGVLGFLKRTASVTALTDCKLYSINQKNFIKISEKYPKIGFKLLLKISLQLSSILEKTNEDVLKLSTALIYALK